MGIDELKLGGYGSMSDIQFWIKVLYYINIKV